MEAHVGVGAATGRGSNTTYRQRSSGAGGYRGAFVHCGSTRVSKRTPKHMAKQIRVGTEIAAAAVVPGGFQEGRDSSQWGTDVLGSLV
jgi:hypothetical protein